MLKVVGNESAHDEGDGPSLLDEIAREGARRMLVAALETERIAYLEAHGDERDDEGHALVVRNGKGRTRKITLGAGNDSCERPSRQRSSDQRALSTSIQNSRTLAEASVDQAKLARSVFGVQKFTRLHADAIGRKSTVWPRVG